MLGAGTKLTELTVALDKTDKIGREGVIQELESRGFSSGQIQLLTPLLNLSGSAEQKIADLKNFFKDNDTGLQGLREMEELLQLINPLRISNAVDFDLSLARGLNYYTGTIFEVKAKDLEIGSICGGGRYDDLAGIFGLSDVSGVGISFGADRIYDVMEQLSLFPAHSGSAIKVLFVNFSTEAAVGLFDLIAAVRTAGINAQLYPEPAKLKKQFAYADSLKIPFVVIAGEEELANSSVKVKNMLSGEQTTILSKDLVGFISSSL
jgi:histidyl-tRNA synthetase